MNVAEWADTYGIHDWQILEVCSRKLTELGFEPTFTEPYNDALTYWAIRPWVQLALRASFVQPIHFHHLFSVTFHFLRLPSSVATFVSSKFSVCNQTTVVEWAATYGIHHRPILWSSYRKMAWVGLEPTTTEPPSDALKHCAIRPWIQLVLRANFVQALQYHRFVLCHVSFQSFALVSRHIYVIKLFCT